MRLTAKDREFLERLRLLMESDDLAVDMKKDGYRRLVLRKNYGAKVERSFGQTRQGVRWRFHRVFNEMYAEAYEAIILIEGAFGASLRPLALEIVRERMAWRRQAQKHGRITPPPSKNRDLKEQQGRP